MSFTLQGPTRPVYIQLHRSEGVISRAIKWQSRGPYAHASILLDDGTIYESVARHGVRKVHAAHYAERYAKNQIDTAQVLVSGPEYERILDFLESQLGKPYDYWGVFQFITRGKQSHRHTNRWFCAELVYQAFAEIDVQFFNRTVAWEVSPTLLGRAPQLHFE